VAAAQPALPPDETKTLGRRVVDAQLRDEHGRELAVSSLEGKPLVVSPIFTKCQHVCPRITSGLKQAIEPVGVPGEEFNVLSVSFDTSDTEEDLMRFRQRLDLPEGWKLTKASSEELLPFLESLDFHFLSQKNGGFIHPNLVVFLTPDLRVAKYLYGVDYDPGDVRTALEIARGRGLLLDRLAPYIFLVGVLGMIATSFVILVTWKRSRPRASSG
jgi:protein SCO1/2